MNLTARSAARLLQVPEERIHEWVAEGVLPAHRVHEQLRFNRVELLEWAANRRMKISPELFGEEAPNCGSLAAALERGGIHRDLPSGERGGAMRALVERLPIAEGADRADLLALFEAREAVSTTAIGGGVAIPHARTPLVAPGGDPVVALAFLDRPLDMDAPDRRPVHALFAVVSPSVRAHLHVLSRIAGALANADFRALVERRAPSEELLAKVREIEGA